MIYLEMILIYVIFVTIIWAVLKVASDSDDQMEKMLREKKAEDTAKLNK